MRMLPASCLLEGVIHVLKNRRNVASDEIARLKREKQDASALRSR